MHNNGDEKMVLERKHKIFFGIVLLLLILALVFFN